MSNLASQAQMVQDSLRGENVTRLLSILARVGYNQIPLIYELQYRENYLNPLTGSQFYADSALDIYLTTAILQKLARFGLAPDSAVVRKLIIDSPLFDFLDSEVDSKAYIVGAIRAINNDCRVMLSDTSVSPDLREAAQSISVIVMPASGKFASPNCFGAYRTIRKQLFQFQNAQNQGQKNRFQDEYSFPNGTRSGILWAPDTVITAGHGLIAGETVYVFSQFSGYQDGPNLRIPNRRGRLGIIKKVISGGPHEPDYAIIWLTTKLSFVSSTGSTKWGNLNKEKPIVAAGHPYGMQSVADTAGAILDAPAYHWQNSAYFFADLDMNKANSGSPVFQEHVVDNDTTYKLVGMVVGSGGIEDFALKDGKVTWNQIGQTKVVGIRILKLPSKISLLDESPRLAETVDSPMSNIDQSMILGTFQSDSAIQADDSTASDSLPDSLHVCLDNAEVYFQLGKIIISTTKGQVVSYPLDDPAIITMIDNRLTIYFDSSLTNHYKTYPPKRDLEFHTDHWPMGLFSNPTHYLKFQYQQTLPPDMPYPHDANEKFNMLDGIGLADIIDNLPDGVKMRRRQIWLCNKDMLEISITPAVEGNPYQAPIVNIRYVRPFVHSYLRTEPDPWPMK